MVAVIGLGALGAAAAWNAARSGASVIGFEQFELGHVRGASHDTSRIIRHSYHTPEYVELTAHAYSAWADVEAATGAEFVTTTGGIDLFPAGCAIPPEDYLRSLTEVGIAHDWIDGAEIRRRWPVFQVDDTTMGITQANTGIVPAGRGTAALLDLAAAAGADLRPHTPVRAVEPVGDGVHIITDSGAVAADVAIIAADAWTARLLRPLGIELPLEVTLEQVTYLTHPRQDRMRVGEFPVWIWMDDPSYYGFPQYGHMGTIKIAEDCGGPSVDPDNRSFAPDPDAERRLCRFVESLLGGPVEVEHSLRCLYTLTSDRDFVVDRLPDTPQIVVGLGAAHGFKFAPWFGTALAALALGTTPPGNIDPFTMQRPSLYAPADRAAWLV